MGKLVLVRHGQSQWNLDNKFTGWVDVDLTAKGLKEAESAGQKIAALQLTFSKAHTSRLRRAQKTLQTILKCCEQMPETWVDSALNERHYGDLQGLNKDEVRQKYGEEQVHIWRRSFDVPPPNGECLADTAKRTLPYFKSYVMPELQAGKNILIAAHGNSLRSIVMFIEKWTSEEILQFEMATGVPHVYDIAQSGKVSRREILSD